MRIGELLKARGLVTDGDIEAALQRQVVHGGRLGTCLVEVVEIGLDAVAEALSEAHGIPAATGRHFDRADAAVMRKIDADLAARHRAIPIGWLSHDPPKIAVASTDPLSVVAVTELSAALEAEVVAAIAPELRVLYYLEAVYGIERLPRFRRTRRTAPDGGPGAERRRYVRTLSDEVAPHPPTQLAKVAVRRIAVPIGQEQQPRLDTIEHALKAIRRATGRDRVGDYVVGSLEQSFDEQLRAGIIFAERDGVLIAWKGFVRGRGQPEALETIALPSDADSMLSEPFESATPYFGSPRGHALDDRLWGVLDLDNPAEIAVVPVVLRRHVVCLIYADAAATMDAATVGGLAEVGQGLAAAFDRLVKAAER